MTLLTQWTTMLLMIGSGLLMGFILDTYRVMKGRLRLHGFVVSLIDLVYWVGSACLIFGLLLYSNWGELRLYIFIAITVGLVLYFYFLSKGMIHRIRVTIQGTERVVTQLLRILNNLLYVPLKNLLKAVHRLVRFIGRSLLTVFTRPLVWLTDIMSRPIRRWAASLFGPFKRMWFGNRKKGDEDD